MNAQSSPRPWCRPASGTLPRPIPRRRWSGRLALLALLLGLTGVTQTGCLLLVAGGAAAAGAGTYAYISGELKATEAVPLDKAWTAGQGAMTELQFPVTTKQKDAVAGKLVARTAADKKVELNLKKLSDNSTEIRIRVGTWGDETLSRLILDKMKKRF